MKYRNHHQRKVYLNTGFENVTKPHSTAEQYHVEFNPGATTQVNGTNTFEMQVKVHGDDLNDNKGK